MAKAKKTEKEGKAPRAANSGKTNVAWLVCSSVFGLTLGVSLYFWNTLKRTSPRFSRKDSFIMTKTHVDMIRKYRSKCDLSVEKLNQLIKDFQSQMSKGLKKEGRFWCCCSEFSFCSLFSLCTISLFLVARNKISIQNLVC